MSKVYVSWAIAVPVLLLEDKQGSLSGGLRRSLRLVGRCWWPVFTVLVLSRIIVSVPSLFIRSLLGSATDGGVTAFLLDAATTAETLITPFTPPCACEGRRLDLAGLSQALPREGAPAASGDKPRPG